MPGGDSAGHSPPPRPPPSPATRWPLMLIMRFSCNPAQSQNRPNRKYLSRRCKRAPATPTPPPTPATPTPLNGFWDLVSPRLSGGHGLTRLRRLMQICQDHLACLHGSDGGRGEHGIAAALGAGAGGAAEARQRRLNSRRSLKVNHSRSFVCFGPSASAV